MDWFASIISSLNNILWSYILIGLLICVGLWFTFCTRFVQITNVREMFRCVLDVKLRQCSKRYSVNKKLSSISLIAEWSCVGKENVLLIEGDMEPVEVRKCTDAILDTCSGVAAFFAGNDKDGYKYAIGQREGDVRELVKQVNKELNGRGGGKPFFAQGSLKATRKQIEIFFEKKVNFQ